MRAREAIAKRNERSETIAQNQREARLTLPLGELFVFTEFKVIFRFSVVAEKCK